MKLCPFLPARAKRIRFFMLKPFVVCAEVPVEPSLDLSFQFQLGKGCFLEDQNLKFMSCHVVDNFLGTDSN